MTREEAAIILHPETQDRERLKYTYKTWVETFDEACQMGAEALRVEGKEASIVMKTRHTFIGPDYERPYCEACNHYVPDANAAFCCWCGARFVTFILPLPEVTA